MNTSLRFGFIIILLLFAHSTYAQFKMSAGNTDIGLRVGAVFPKTSTFNKYEDFNASSPAFGFFFETGLWNFGLSAGGEFNYATFKNEKKTGNMTVLTGMVYLKYYPSFLVVAKFAPYARLDLLPIGVFKISTPDQTESGAKSIMGFYAGANYQFADSFGAFAELGIGYTVINGGISWRIAEN